MNTTNAIVQFSDTRLFETNKNWFGLLKDKLRESLFIPKFVFFSGGSGEVKQFEIVRNSLDSQFQDLKFLRKFWKETNLLSGVLWFVVNKQSNELISSRWGKKVQIFDLNNEKKMQTVRLGQTPYGAAWYLEKYLIICNIKSEIEIWDWETKQVKNVLLECHNKAIRGLIVNDESHELWSHSVDGTIKLWCLKTLVCLRTFACEGSIESICFLNHNKTLFVSGCMDIIIWDKHTGKCLHNQENPHGPWVSSVIYSKCLGLLISCGFDTKIKVWEFNRNQIDLKLCFKIENPFGKANEKMEFLNPKKQTQILVISNCNTFVIDLVSRKVIWTMENICDNIRMNILVQ